jgi:hypothetical protein
LKIEDSKLKVSGFRSQISGFTLLVSNFQFSILNFQFPRWGVRAAVMLFSITILLSCASSKHKPHKKLKPGKPIPCPQKDC